MNNLLIKLQKTFTKGYYRIFSLITAAILAVIAQLNLPPANHTLTLDNPLPVPIWKSFFLMEGPLVPFRLSVIFFLAAILLVILTFSGDSIKKMPWKKLKLIKPKKPLHKQPSLVARYKLSLDRGQKQIDVRFRGDATYWIRIGSTLILLILAIFLAVINFFIFKQTPETYIGLAVWMTSLALLLASVSVYGYFKNNPFTGGIRRYLWAISAFVYFALSIWLYTMGSAWGMFFWLSGVLSLFAWKFKRERKTTLPPPLVSANPAIPLLKPTLRQRVHQVFRKIMAGREWMIFGLILVVGCYFRFANIFTLEPGLNNDVAGVESVAISIIRGTMAYSPFSSVGWGYETMFFYFIAFWMYIVGPNFLAARLAGAIIGCITLVVVYFLARHLAGKQVAWISMALLAACGIHIIFSDLSNRIILQPLLEPLSLLLFWKALEKRQYWLFVLTGISLGLAAQAYNASVFYPLLVLLFCVYLLVKNWKKRKQIISQYLPGMLIVVLAFFITTSSIMGYASGNWDSYRARSDSLLVTHRMQESESATPGTYWYPLMRNFFVGSMIFNQRGNCNDLFIEDPALDIPVNILFVLALAFTLRYWKKPLPFYLLTWFLLSVSAGYFSEPNANRVIGSFVPICLMCALFLSASIELFKEKFKREGYFLASSISILLVLITLGVSYWIYVGPEYRYRPGHAEKASAIGLYVNRFLNQYDVYVTDSYYVTDTVRMMTYRPWEDYNERPYHVLRMYDILVGNIPVANNKVFVFGNWPEDLLARDILLKLYPQGKEEQIPPLNTHWDNEKDIGSGVFLTSSALKNQAPLDQGLVASQYSEWDGGGTLLRSFVDPFLSLPAEIDPDMGHFSVVWEGVFTPEVAGIFTFQIRSNNRLKLWVDDSLVTEINEFSMDNPETDHEAEGSINLDTNQHRIKIIYNYEGGNYRFGILWKFADRGFDWVPVWSFTPIPYQAPCQCKL